MHHSGVEAPINPPEQPDREPKRFDDIDFDTVGCWKDKVKQLIILVLDGGEAQDILPRLQELWAAIDEALNTAQGFNDEMLSEEDMRSAHDDNKLHQLREEGPR